MKHFLLFSFAILLALCPVFAQKNEKRSLTTSDFSAWKSLNNPTISNSGEFVAFEVNPAKGDGKLFVKTIDSKKEDILSRAFSAQFSPESDYIVYKIKQPEDSVRSVKKRKLKPEQMPKDSVGIFVLKTRKQYTFASLKQFSLPKQNARWIPIMTEVVKPKAENKEEGKSDKSKKDSKPETQLILLRPQMGDTLVFSKVPEFAYAADGRTIAFIRQLKDSIDRSEIVAFNTETGKATVVFKSNGTAKKIAIDREGNQLGFLFSTDTIQEKVYKLFYGRIPGEPKAAVDAQTREMPIDWSPSEFADLSFSDNGLYLFFGTARKPFSEPKDTLLADEKPTLDIWNWKDRELQPEQKINLEKEQKRTYRAAYRTDMGKFVQLADPTMRDLLTIQKGNGSLALGSNSIPYKLQFSWTGRLLADYYLVEVETGKRQLIARAKRSASLSPAGNYVIWYEPKDSSYYVKATSSEKNDSIRLNKGIPVSFCDEEWDTPDAPNSYGIAGWSENDKAVYIYDRYDIWRFDPSGEKVAVNVTRNYGRKNQLRFRYLKLNPEEEFINTSAPCLVSAFDERQKSSGFFEADFRNYTEPKLLMMDDKYFDGLKKAKNAPTLIWTAEDVDEAPDLWTSNTLFERRHQLSITNPEQKNFVWPAVRLVQWTSFSGKPLEGMLYYPENLDPQRKYPMIVYFYERNANNLHIYAPPVPSRSSINRTFYTSNDYIVFVPDITYEDGYPGKSAFDAVVSGTQLVCNLFSFIDRNKIGIQGQSWGGYQVAWLITQTKMFAAAMAGAPVANMTSAYDGIRWESGLVRQFQYEKSQSRIGGTLWDKPLQFIENSPIFFVPKIETPLLIMHNDNDGAVPWYQGIELFTAMRRLQKPVWMLTYNNEEHNLKAESWANKMDLTIRTKQFFDFYLKGEAEPDWMKYGIPATDKGKRLGY